MGPLSGFGWNEPGAVGDEKKVERIHATKSLGRISSLQSRDSIANLMIEEEKSSSRSDLTSIVPVEVTGNSSDENISIDIIEHVGVGGFSNVYVGRMHIGASESIYPVAIKQILKKIPRSYACYQRELNSLNALSNSPYIIKLFGWVECNRYYSLLLGYSKHGDLCNFIMKR